MPASKADELLAEPGEAAALFHLQIEESPAGCFENPRLLGLEVQDRLDVQGGSGQEEQPERPVGRIGDRAVLKLPKPPLL